VGPGIWDPRPPENDRGAPSPPIWPAPRWPGGSPANSARPHGAMYSSVRATNSTRISRQPTRPADPSGQPKGFFVPVAIRPSTNEDVHRPLYFRRVKRRPPKVIVLADWDPARARNNAGTTKPAG